MRRPFHRLRRVSANIIAISLEKFAEANQIRMKADRGQTTAEYALVLLGAAGIALLLLGWVTQSGAVGTLFDAVLDSVVGRVK